MLNHAVKNFYIRVKTSTSGRKLLHQGENFYIRAKTSTSGRKLLHQGENFYIRAKTEVIKSQVKRWLTALDATHSKYTQLHWKGRGEREGGRGGVTGRERERRGRERERVDVPEWLGHCTRNRLVASSKLSQGYKGIMVACTSRARILRECLPALFSFFSPLLFSPLFLKVEISSHTLIPLYARISPQWLSDLRRL